ncbi:MULTISPECIES: hypothetical protein [Petrotoga]|uniref:hypothetical protein n=1 Tax=Petrotoga TaxID=28236 RepID=UPI0010655A4B|nr:MULTISPECIES: hypothetical protein [Petrotoga]
MNLYKYADISIPPGENSQIMKIDYINDLFYINYSNKTLSTSLEKLDSVFHEILNELPRSVFVIAENSHIVTDNGTKTSAFLSWDKNMNIVLDVNGFIFEHQFSPPIGEVITRVPSKWIELEITGYSKEVTLNNLKIKTPITIQVPPSKITLTDGLKKTEIDLTNYEGEKYTLDLKKQQIYEKVETKIDKVFEIESGVFFYGEPLSVWLPKKGEPVVTKSRFYCDYGDIEEKSKTFHIDGEIVFAYEKDNTVYLISSSGQFVTLGKKNINRDFERSPLSILVTDEYIQLKTFKLESYRIEFAGGIFKEGNVYNMFLDLPSYEPQQNYDFGNFNVEIAKNEVVIYTNEN